MQISCKVINFIAIKALINNALYSKPWWRKNSNILPLLTKSNNFKYLTIINGFSSFIKIFKIDFELVTIDCEKEKKKSLSKKEKNVGKTPDFTLLASAMFIRSDSRFTPDTAYFFYSYGNEFTVFLWVELQKKKIAHLEDS